MTLPQVSFSEIVGQPIRGFPHGNERTTEPLRSARRGDLDVDADRGEPASPGSCCGVLRCIGDRLGHFVPAFRCFPVRFDNIGACGGKAFGRNERARRAVLTAPVPTRRPDEDRTIVVRSHGIVARAELWKELPLDEEELD